jgi:transposase
MTEAKAATKFSRHVNEQHRWTEEILSALRDLLSSARHFKMTQEEYLKRREEIYEKRKISRLTVDRRAYIDGYMRAMYEVQGRELIHVRRIIDRPERVSSAKWDDMPEDIRQACRDGNTESCLAWDKEGKFPYGLWSK